MRYRESVQPNHDGATDASARRDEGVENDDDEHDDDDERDE